MDCHMNKKTMLYSNLYDNCTQRSRSVRGVGEICDKPMSFLNYILFILSQFFSKFIKRNEDLYQISKFKGRVSGVWEIPLPCTPCP